MIDVQAVALGEPPAPAPGLAPWLLYLLSVRNVEETGPPDSGQSVAPCR